MLLVPPNTASIAVFYLAGRRGIIEYHSTAMFERIKKFFSESRQELRHVNWPTRKEAMRLTSIVIAIALGLAIFLGAFDYLFTYLIKTFIVQ
jgi:preprotein translocase subunit SecE